MYTKLSDEQAQLHQAGQVVRLHADQTVRLHADQTVRLHADHHADHPDQQDPWDRLGIFLSSLCAVHCLLTPILVLTLPFVAEKFENPWVHIIMAVFVVPVGSYAFWSGFRHHGKWHILLTGLFGLSLIGIAAAMSDVMPVFLFGHEGVTIIGSVFLLTAHVMNLREGQKCDHPHHRHPLAPLR
jgi:hypothetical protein